MYLRVESICSSKQAVWVLTFCLAVHTLLEFFGHNVILWLGSHFLSVILFLFLNQVVFGYAFWHLTKGPKFTTLFILTAIALSNLLLLMLALDKLGIDISYRTLNISFALLNSPLLFAVFIVAKLLKHSRVSV